MSCRCPGVAITGMGVLSPLGAATATFENLIQGRSGVRPLSDLYGCPVRIAAPLPLGEELPHLTPMELARYDRSTNLALSAARTAWADAAAPEVDPLRLAVVVSAGLGGVASMMEAASHQILRGSVGTRAAVVPRVMSNAAAAAIAAERGAGAGTYAMVSACASGSDSLALAYRLLAAGEADVVVAGGTEATVTPVAVNAFAALRALSTRNLQPTAASRPFDRDRDGFVMAEGAAVFVLESERHAQRRGARILGHLAGVGVSSDGHDLIRPEPTGAGAARAMQACLRSADLGPGDISGVFAHATSTPRGDSAEALALHRVFAPGNAEVPVTAIKSMLGHCLGASGPIATATALLAGHRGVLPATLNYEHPDPAYPDPNIVHDKPLDLPMAAGHAFLVNAFGFGGQNVVLCLLTC